MFLVAAVALGSWVSCRAGDQRPGFGSGSGSGDADGDVNVVLVSIDTLRADRLNAYGYEERVTSPHLDALAREGILFETFITAAPGTDAQLEG